MVKRRIRNKTKPPRHYILYLYFQGFSDKDVYVCESRYSSRLRGFKKIKVEVKLKAFKQFHYRLIPMNDN